jgi:hypothetical protein
MYFKNSCRKAMDCSFVKNTTAFSFSFAKSRAWSNSSAVFGFFFVVLTTNPGVQLSFSGSVVLASFDEVHPEEESPDLLKGGKLAFKTESGDCQNVKIV